MKERIRYNIVGCDEMERVVIRISSRQFSPEGALVAEHSSSSVGHRQTKGDKILVRYLENEDSGLGDTITVLKWSGDRLVVVRSGAVESRQEFAVGLHKSGVYHTLHGDFPLDYTTMQLASEQQQGLLVLSAVFGLSIGEAPQNVTHLRIEIEEDAAWKSKMN